MIVDENGTQYEIDEQTGLVVKAQLSDEALEQEAEAIADEFRLGDRVEVAGKVGNIISVVPSLYGAAFGVHFDDGEVDEFGEQQLKRTAAERQTFDSPILEVYARYEAYLELPGYTEDELSRKEAEARWIHLTASSLRSYTAQGGIRDPKLDQIILVTSSDLREMKDIRQSAESPSSQRYLSSFNQYQIADEIGQGAPNMGKAAHVSADWLDDAYEGMEVVETTDADLAARATEVVASLTREQLEDDEFMSLVASFQNEYLRNDDGREKKFASYLAAARKEQLKGLPPTEKQASTEDLSDIAVESLYL